MCYEAWEYHLRNHPNRSEVQATLDGIRYGERILFSGDRSGRIAHQPPLSEEHAEAVRSFIVEGLREGTILGPFAEPPCDDFHSSPIVVVGKDDGGFRVCINMTERDGLGVNCGIDLGGHKPEYCTHDEVVGLIQGVGPGALMAKEDHYRAYKQIPVHPDDWNLQGFEFEGEFFIDTRLVFGCCSSALIQGRYASQVEWILKNEFGIENTCHFADDHFFVFVPVMEVAQEGMRVVQGVFRVLGLVLHDGKRVAPTTFLKMLGVCYDSVSMEQSVPQEKAQRALELFRDAAKRKSLTVFELQRLLGNMAWLSKVVVQGRPFTGRLVAFLTACEAKRAAAGASRMSHHYRLDACALKDLWWWIHFMPRFSCRSLFLDSLWSRAADIEVGCDASLFAGGAYCGSQWIFVEWSPEQILFASESGKPNIAILEALILLIAAGTWGHLWAHKRILFWSDNSATVAAVEKRRPKHPALQEVMRLLHFIEAENGFVAGVSHIAGEKNGVADAISRREFRRFVDLFWARYGHLPDEFPIAFVIPQAHWLAK